MKESMSVVIAFLAAVNFALANLGDSGDKIEDSYGAVMQRRLRDDGSVSVIYKKDRYLYLVTFANDRSVSETYSHLQGTDLSDREIMKLLKQNAAGAKWISDNTGTGRRFTRSDGKAEAIYAPVNGRPALTVRAVPFDHRRPGQ